MKSLQIKQNEINNFHFNIDLIKKTPKACTWLPKKILKLTQLEKIMVLTTKIVMLAINT
jgi:cell division protein FtsL